MVTSLRIVHTADWHLGNSYKNYPARLGADLERQAAKSLQHLVDILAKSPCDLLVFAGDTFHQSLAKADVIAEFDYQLSRLKARQIIILPGNHDPYYPGSNWTKLRNLNREEVLLIGQDQPYYDLPDLGVRVFAKSFKTKLCNHNMFSSRLETRPDLRNILIGHGDLVGPGQTSFYQPISRQWLGEQGLDLCLMGHIHQPSVEFVGPRNLPVVYPGSAQSTGWGELGPRGVELIEINRSGHLGFRHKFIALNGTRFFQRKIDLSYLAKQVGWQSSPNTDDLYLALMEEIESWSDYRPDKDMLKIDLYGNLDLDFPLELIQEKLAQRLYNLTLNSYLRPSLDLPKLELEQSFLGAAYRQKQAALARDPDSSEDIEAAWNLLVRQYGASL